VKPIAIAVALACAGLWAAGAAAPWVPRGALPDPALLAAIALGLHLPGVRGLVAAWAIGWQADFLSTGPLGAFAFAALLAWIATRLGERQLALARPVALVPFTAALTVGQVALLAMLGVGPPAGDPRVLPVLLLHGLANALAVPYVARLFGVLVGGADVPEAPRTALRFDAGAPLR
jgi:cell shape-determining protein MreD